MIGPAATLEKKAVFRFTSRRIQFQFAGAYQHSILCDQINFLHHSDDHKIPRTVCTSRTLTAMSQRQKPPQTNPFSIVIIGGGIGGLRLALGLIRRGIPVQVYEQASEFGEVGQGVAFGPNMFHAMSLVDPAIRKAFEKLATHAAEEEMEGVGRPWIDIRYGGDNTDMIVKIQTFDSI